MADILPGPSGSGGAIAAGSGAGGSGGSGGGRGGRGGHGGGGSGGGRGRGRSRIRGRRRTRARIASAAPPRPDSLERPHDEGLDRSPIRFPSRHRELEPPEVIAAETLSQMHDPSARQRSLHTKQMTIPLPPPQTPGGGEGVNMDEARGDAPRLGPDARSSPDRELDVPFPRERHDNDEPPAPLA